MRSTLRNKLYYNYYQYYQSMQQQDQPDYNNKNYGYNNDYKHRRISYNNSYGDTKKYSTYPTKCKKYVCQRGQFEGFCVESVEFCKLKIPQGSPGPQGQQGPPGPQGPMEPLGEPVPQDPNQINPTSIYKVGASATASTEVTGDATYTAMCDQGDSALSISYGIANTPVFVTDRISETRDGWVTTKWAFYGK